MILINILTYISQACPKFKVVNGKKKTAENFIDSISTVVIYRPSIFYVKVAKLMAE